MVTWHNTDKGRTHKLRPWRFRLKRVKLQTVPVHLSLLLGSPFKHCLFATCKWVFVSAPATARGTPSSADTHQLTLESTSGQAQPQSSKAHLKDPSALVEGSPGAAGGIKPRFKSLNLRTRVTLPKPPLPLQLNSCLWRWRQIRG